MAVCNVCFRHCNLKSGEVGFCGARIGVSGIAPDTGAGECADGGTVTALNYGRATALALDPIEKKPLARFYPGSMILSYGSFGCNLRCPFCQNYEISWSEEAEQFSAEARRAFAVSEEGDSDSPESGRFRTVSPEELAATAAYYRDQGNIGVAFTYNEPLVGYEYVRDTAALVHEYGMKNVIVTNGTASLEVLGELEPYIDAMNIDLKGFTDHYYNRVLGGSRKMVMDFIERAVQFCHVELTTLIVPGENDSEEEMRELSAWVAGLDRQIPLHITRFFPQFHMTDRRATDVRHIYRLAEIARGNLDYVYTGNCN